MKKKYIAPVAIALIATISIITVSCGKSPDEAVVATEVMTSEEETTVEETTVEETTVEETTEVEESTEEIKRETKAETTTERAQREAETTKAAIKRETKAETKAAPKAETKVGAPKTPAPTQAAPAPTQAPAHVHQWKEHKATREEWVPNIVSVPDYEVKDIIENYYVCNCGFETNNGSVADEHSMNHILNGENDCYSLQKRVVGTETIQVGVHDEDKGFYQNVEYIDFYYCDCGATK